MRIAVWQTDGVNGDAAANLARLAVALAQARAAGAALLLTPELWSTGYSDPDAIRAGAEVQGGSVQMAVAGLARQFGVAIAYGYPERSGALLYNAAQLVGADGVAVGHYRKLHLWGDYERGLFVPGDLPDAPFDYGGWRMAFSICYDTEFPELIRRYAMAGAELVLAPTALTAGVAAIPDLVVPVRALENGVFIAFANRCGDEGTVAWHGGSCIVGPSGEKLAATGGGPGLLIADLDRPAIAAARVRSPYLAERRSDLGVS